MCWGLSSSSSEKQALVPAQMKKLFQFKQQPQLAQTPCPSALNHHTVMKLRMSFLFTAQEMNLTLYQLSCTSTKQWGICTILNNIRGSHQSPAVKHSSKKSCLLKSREVLVWIRMIHWDTNQPLNRILPLKEGEHLFLRTKVFVGRIELLSKRGELLHWT